MGREYPGRVVPGAVAWLVRRGVRPGLGGGGPEWCVPWGLTGVGTDSTSTFVPVQPQSRRGWA